MSKANLLERGNEIQRKREPVISGRLAFQYLNLSDRVFFPAVKAGHLIAQAEMRRPGRTEYNFAIAYLDEVAKVLPKERQHGLEVFSEELQARLAPINKEWNGKKDVNWEHDAAETKRVMELIKKRKKKPKKK